MNKSQDFARCMSGHRKECETCQRNANINPPHSQSQRQVWIGVWVLETPCESRVPVGGQA